MTIAQMDISKISEEQFIVYCLEKLNEAFSLNFSESYKLMDNILLGKLTPIQLSAILTSLRVNDINAQEIAGLSQAMLDHALKISYSGKLPLIDIVGTGGAKFKTFNVSTTASLVMPLLDVAVAKHGNRTSTAQSGSADLLEALGVNIMMLPENVERCLNEINLTFMFAPTFHPAMKNVIAIRKELKVKTAFNLLGPLVNPAHVNRQMTGVFSPNLLIPIINCFKVRDFERVAVFYNDLGADEIIQIGTTKVYELNEGKIEKFELRAEDFGVQTCTPVEIHNRDPKETAKRVIETLSGTHSPISDFVAINVALGLRIAGKEEDLKVGTEMALDALETGGGIDILEKLVRSSEGNLDQFELISR